MSSYAKLARKPVPQTEPLTPKQVANNAGGYVFALDDWKRLDRFLILGSDAPTYYQSAPKLTRENAACVERCYAADPGRTVDRIVEVSIGGRAPKNDSAIFAIALGTVAPDVGARRLAFHSMARVCRTATHLFQFINVRRALGGGSGRAFKRAVADWYRGKKVDDIAYQAVKYRAREGFSHDRALNLADFGFKRYPAARSLVEWIKGKDVTGTLPPIVLAHMKAMSPDTTSGQLCDLIRQYNLPWEAIPTSAKTDPAVWQALLPSMGLTAMVRNLGAMTSCGALKPLSKETRLVCDKLGNAEEIRRARLHPLSLLMALRVYETGHSQTAVHRTVLRRAAGGTTRDAQTWAPIPAIAVALEDAFYLSFATITPSGKRTLVGLDVSGSMSCPFGGTMVSCCEGAAAMAMTVLRTEPQSHVMAFDQGMRDLGLTAAMRLSEVVERTDSINGGGTDCALPMLVALKQGWEVDTFQVFTDNETYAGVAHPVAALLEYRRKTGIAAKLIVVGMTATNFTIADPDDPGMLDVVGFDSAAPAVMAEFSRG